MDKLGQIVYKNEDLIYKYKDEVDIPCLGMVDDIMCIQKCNIKSVEINAAVNAFIESKKLTLSKLTSMVSDTEMYHQLLRPTDQGHEL